MAHKWMYSSGVKRDLQRTWWLAALGRLIEEMIVDLVNDEKAGSVTSALLQMALGECIVRGHNVLHEPVDGNARLLASEIIPRVQET
jgi:hypothetical protein